MTGIFTYRNFSLADTPPLDGKVAVITGGSAEITKQLLIHRIHKVYVIGRSQEKYEIALREWRELDESNVKRVEFLQCDLADIRAVQDVARRIKEKTDRLDILFCNAGLPLKRAYSLSPQSIEIIFAVNTVGHHILTTLLLPLLKSTTSRFKTNDARIILTTSSLHSLCRELDLSLLTSPTRTKNSLYDGIWRYARSKVGNILFTRELSRRLLLDRSDPRSRDVFVNCFFPGNIATEQMDVWKEYFGPVLGWLFKMVFAVVGQSTRDAAAGGLYLAASEEIVEDGDGVRGEYFIPIAERCETSELAGDMELAGELWRWTENKAAETLGEGWQDVD
ncbi:hypothetical protein FQN54_000927 [Arachnomyces sp. PD_36]|nr:hypothetical protein FQN54_000927 [Arachnomyces sp. PD_36]